MYPDITWIRDRIILIDKYGEMQFIDIKGKDIDTVTKEGDDLIIKNESGDEYILLNYKNPALWHLKPMSSNRINQLQDKVKELEKELYDLKKKIGSYVATHYHLVNDFEDYRGME